MSPAWDRAAVVGTRTFVLTMLPVSWLIGMALPQTGKYADVGDGLPMLCLVACVLGIPVSVGNAFLACWLADKNRLSAVYIAVLLAVLADFALVGGYFSVCLMIW